MTELEHYFFYQKVYFIPELLLLILPIQLRYFLYKKLQLLLNQRAFSASNCIPSFICCNNYFCYVNILYTFNGGLFYLVPAVHIFCLQHFKAVSFYPCSKCILYILRGKIKCPNNVTNILHYL